MTKNLLWVDSMESSAEYYEVLREQENRYKIDVVDKVTDALDKIRNPYDGLVLRPRYLKLGDLSLAHELSGRLSESFVVGLWFYDRIKQPDIGFNKPAFMIYTIGNYAEVLFERAKSDKSITLVNLLDTLPYDFARLVERKLIDNFRVGPRR